MPDYPHGLTVRVPQLDGDGPDADGPDVDLAFAVSYACELALSDDADSSRDEVRSMLAGAESRRDAHRLVLDGDTPVGLLMVEVSPGRTVFADAYAVPGRAPGLLDALVADGVASAQRIAAEELGHRAPSDVDPYEPNNDLWQVAAGAYGEDEVYRSALQRNGFHLERRFWRMRIDLAASGVGPEDPPAPAGVTRRVASTDEELRALHRVTTESFLDHHNYAPRPYDDWMAVVANLPGVDRTRWWLAYLDGEPVGVCLLDDSRAEMGDGYVRTLGVTRAARGRGIAKWLLRSAFADSVRRGHRGVQLTVDSESPTGATRLYESAGMSVLRVIDDWRRPVDDALVRPAEAVAAP